VASLATLQPAASEAIGAGQAVATAVASPAPVTLNTIVTDVLTWVGLGTLTPSVRVPAWPVPSVIDSFWLAVRDLHRRITGGVVVGTVTIAGQPSTGLALSPRPVLNADGTRALITTVTTPLSNPTTRAAVIDTASGIQAGATVEVPGMPVKTLFSADGSRAVVTTSAYDSTTSTYLTRMAVIDAASGAQIGNTVTLTGGLQLVNADGTRAVITSAGTNPETQVKVIDPTTGTQFGSTVTLPGNTSSPAVSSADGSRVLITTGPSFGEAGTTRAAVIDLHTGAQIGSTIALLGHTLDLPVFSADGSRAVIGATEGDGLASTTRVAVIDPGTGTQIGTTVTLAGTGYGSGAPRLNADDSRALVTSHVQVAATGTETTVVAVIDTATGMQAGSAQTFAGFVHPLLSADGTHAVVVSPVTGSSTQVATIDLATGTTVGTPITRPGTWYMPLAGQLLSVSADGRRILLASDVTNPNGSHSTQVAIIDAITGAQTGTTVTLAGTEFGSRLVSTDGSRAVIETDTYDGATSINTNRLAVIDITTGAQIGTTTTLTGFRDGSLFSADTSRLVITARSSNFVTTGVSTTQVAVINTETGNQVGSLTLNTANGSTLLSANGTRAVVNTGTQLAVLDTVTGAQVGATRTGGSYDLVTPDGTRALVVTPVPVLFNPLTQVDILQIS